jgi:hypothetical protein
MAERVELACNAAPRASSRPWIRTVAPASQSSAASARPSPSVAPVIRIVCCASGFIAAMFAEESADVRHAHDVQ